jgi:hypothetical protein
MFKNAVLALAAGGTLLSASAALADPWKDESGNGRRGYEERGRYYEQRRGDRDVWRGDDGRYRCRRPDGTIGLVVGGAAGALAGRAVDTRGDRTAGTVLGAAAGALLGREAEDCQLPLTASRCR